MEQGTNTASSTEMPLKRKRGRPRKSRPPVPGILGERSGSTTPTTNIPSNGKDRVEEGEDDVSNNDEMVGQMVTGIVENEFDGGYVINIRAGDSNVCFRGVVFKEGCVVPVTPENDIAPDAKMYKRTEYPIPTVNSSSILRQTADTCLNPMENIENQPQKILSEDVTRNDDQLPANGKLDDMEQQEKFLDDLKKFERVSDDKDQEEKISDDIDDEQHVKLSNDSQKQEKISDDKEQVKKLSDDIVEEQHVNLLDDPKEQEKVLDDMEHDKKLSEDIDEEQHVKLLDDPDKQEKVSDDMEQDKLSDDKDEEQSEKL